MTPASRPWWRRWTAIAALATLAVAACGLAFFALTSQKADTPPDEALLRTPSLVSACAAGAPGCAAFVAAVVDAARLYVGSPEQSLCPPADLAMPQLMKLLERRLQGVEALPDLAITLVQEAVGRDHVCVPKRDATRSHLWPGARLRAACFEPANAADCEWYVLGVANTISLTERRREREKRWICLPVFGSSESLARVLRDQLRQRDRQTSSSPDDRPAAVAVFFAFLEQYPCRKLTLKDWAKEETNKGSLPRY